jgi:MOSC domain-containing protein YiiM
MANSQESQLAATVFQRPHMDADQQKLKVTLSPRGVKLNSLLNAEFTIGAARLRGVELCEPCVLVGNSLSGASLSQTTVIKHWLHRGGLRADVLSDGEIVRGVRTEMDESIR